MKPAQFRFFQDEIYQFGFWIVSGSNEAISSSMRRINPNWKLACDFKSDGLTVWDPDHDRFFIIISENHKTWTGTITTLVHECFHATCRVMLERGIPLDSSSEEAFAYHLDFVFEKCLNRLLEIDDYLDGVVSSSPC